MKHLWLGLVLLFSVTALAAAEAVRISPAEAAKRVAAGTAVLVDVREPAEWVATGVATPALLLPKSEFDDGERGDWKPFLEKNRDKQVILYCRSGHRAGVLGAVLAARGFQVANAGGLKDWESAGLPVRLVAEPSPGKK
jgi:rhodanese-related sulfurtransferase